VCRAASVAVPFATAVPIHLDCADPNGDPLTYAIASGPAKGQLGGVDPAGQVVYTPAAGFSGADQFSYRATGRGVTSAPVPAPLPRRADARGLGQRAGLQHEGRAAGAPQGPDPDHAVPLRGTGRQAREGRV